MTKSGIPYIDLYIDLATFNRTDGSAAGCVKMSDLIAADLEACRAVCLSSVQAGLGPDLERASSRT